MPTATNTPTSQRSLARLAVGGSRRALSASTGGDRAGPPGRLERCRERHEQPDRDRQEHRRRGDPSALERDRADRFGRRRRRARRGRCRRRARRSIRRYRGVRAWIDDEPSDLPARRAGSPQQAQLSDALGDGHRQRVEDQERADEQGDRRDERGRRAEVGRRERGATRPGRCGDDRTYGSVVSATSSAWRDLGVASRPRRRRCRHG